MDIFNLKKYRRGLLLSLWICCILSTSYDIAKAQNIPLEYQKVDIISGLSQNSVLSAFQDRTGFLWFGTTDGLNRFDGREFTSLICDVKNPNTISNNVIKAICEGKNNNLYIGTEDGLNIYIRTSQKFQRFFRDTLQKTTLPSNFVNGLVIENDNQLLVGTNKGLVIFDVDKKVFIDPKTLIKETHGLDTLNILDICKDSKKNIWVGTYNRGIYRFKPQKKEITQFIINDEKAYSYLNNTIYRIYEDSFSNIWLATNNGIAKIDNNSGKIKRYLNSKSPSTLENSLYFQSLIQTTGGILLAGSGDYGMYQYDYKKDEFSPISIRKNESGRLSGNSYLCMVEDKSGVLWLGTSSEGLLKINLYNKAFKWVSKIEGNINSIADNNITALLEDHNHNIWIGTQNGLSIWNRTNNSFTHLLPDKKNTNSIKSSYILYLYEDSENNIWIGTTDGIDVFYSKEKIFKHYFTDYASKNQIPNNYVYCIKEATDGQIWIATLDGLCKFDQKEMLFENYFYNDKDTNSIPSNTIWDIHIDSRKDIWFATSNGLAKYLPKKDAFQRYTIGEANIRSRAQQEVYSIEEDLDGSFWCCTSMFGVLRFDPLSGEKKHFPILKRFGTNTVYSLKIYKNFIWFASVKGLGRLDRKTGEILIFNNKDGIKSNEFNAPSLLSHDSLLFYGGINGITYFKPEEIKIDSYQPPLVFTGLKINFKDILPGEEYRGQVPLEVNINSAEKIILRHDVNVFSISFSSLDYKINEKISYSYKLEGVDNEWISLENENNIKFTGLSPKKYTLLVKATNSDGIWNEKPRILQIIIKPPWWKTLWFRAFIIFTFMVGLLILIKSREKRLREAKIKLEASVRSRTHEIEMQKEEIESQKDLIEKQNEKLTNRTLHLEEEVEKRLSDLIIARDKAEESDRLKSAFLSNISHEIRTPLNAIIGFSELLSEHDISKDEQHKFLDIIKNKSNDLLNIFNKVIDISVIQSKKLSLINTEFSPKIMLEEIYNNYIQKIPSQESNAELRLDIDIDSYDFTIYSDPIRLKQILSYLLNNAIKYTERGSINFGYRKKEKHLEFFVKDTGIGIPDDQLSNLFTRFKKIERDKEKLYRGTGLGLSISKDLIELMGGRIYVESKTGVGTNFYFTIPISIK